MEAAPENRPPVAAACSQWGSTPRAVKARSHATSSGPSRSSAPSRLVQTGALRRRSALTARPRFLTVLPPCLKKVQGALSGSLFPINQRETTRPTTPLKNPIPIGSRRCGGLAVCFSWQSPVWPFAPSVRPRGRRIRRPPPRVPCRDQCGPGPAQCVRPAARSCRRTRPDFECDPVH